MIAFSRLLIIYCLMFATLVSCSFSLQQTPPDTLPPYTPEFALGLNLDYKTHLGLTTTPEAKWNHVSDSSGGRGVSHYEVAVGGGDVLDSVVAWTNVGLQTSKSFEGLSLQRGVRYRLAVRAVDKAGNRSLPLTSEEWYAEPNVVDYNVEQIGLKLNGSVYSRLTDTEGNEFLTGNFTRYAFSDHPCMLESSILGDFNYSWGQSLDQGCVGAISKAAIQTTAQGSFAIVVGSFTKIRGVVVPGLARVNLTTGEVDSEFNSNIGTGGAGISAIEIDSNGKILLGGSLTTFNGSTVGRIVRLNEDGTIDPSFGVGSGFGGAVDSIDTFSDGRIVLGGSFTQFNGVSISKGIAVLNSDGSLNATFAAGSGTGFAGVGSGYYVSFVNVTNAGQILVTGRFTEYNGHTEPSICAALLNADGTIDLPFNTNIAKNFYSVNITGVEELSDNSYLFTGGIYQYKGQSFNTILKVSSAGTIDPVFTANTNPDTASGSVKALIDQDKIFLMGTFTSMNGNSAYRSVTQVDLSGAVNPLFDNTQLATLNDRPVTGLVSSGKLYLFGNLYYSGGKSAPRLIKIDSGGLVDESFLANLSINILNSTALRDFILTGEDEFYIRYQKSGGLDESECITTMGTSCALNSPLNLLPTWTKFMPDGSFLLTSGVIFDGQPLDSLTRVLPNGQIDSQFNLNLGQIDPFIFYTPRVVGNKIYMTGTFSQFSSYQIGGILRYNFDGTPDLAFNTNLGNGLVASSGIFLGVPSVTEDGQNGDVYFTIQKILGATLTFNGVTVPDAPCYRIKSNGEFDYEFASKLSAQISTTSWGGVRILPDESLLIWGTFSINSSSYSLIRVNKLGDLDTEFLARTSISSSILGVDFNENNDLFIYGSGEIIRKGSVLSEQGYLRLRSAF